MFTAGTELRQADSWLLVARIKPESKPETLVLTIWTRTRFYLFGPTLVPHDDSRKISQPAERKVPELLAAADGCVTCPAYCSPTDKSFIYFSFALDLDVSELTKADLWCEFGRIIEWRLLEMMTS